MNIWTIALYELRRMLTSRTVLLMQFALPLLLIFILGSALSTVFHTADKVIKPVSVALVQQDSGVMKDALSTFLENSKTTEVIHITKFATPEEAKQQVKLGNKEFGLIVPADFSNKVTSGQSAEWEMILGNDYGQNLTAQIVLGSFLDQVNLNQAVIIAAGSDASQAIQHSSRAANSDQTNSFVQVGNLADSDANYSASQYYAASMLIMFLLYSGMMAAISLLNEKEKHTLMRLNSMPIPEVQLLLGKIIGSSLIALLQALIIITATTAFYGVNWGNSYGMLFVVCLLVTVASMSLAVIGTMLAGSTKAVTSIFQFLIVIMTFLSGGFSPLPEGLLQRLGEFTVNHWALQSLLRMMLGNSFSVIVEHVSILGIIAAALMLISLAAYRKVGYHE